MKIEFPFIFSMTRVICEQLPQDRELIPYAPRTSAVGDIHVCQMYSMYDWLNFMSEKLSIYIVPLTFQVTHVLYSYLQKCNHIYMVASKQLLLILIISIRSILT